jgi:preprotein translocase subunit SecA
MIDAVLAKIFGTKHEREVKAILPIIASINALEPQMQALSDEGLAAQTAKFRHQLEIGRTLDDLLVEAFATVREAGRRFVNMRHFDVQLIGGITLHRGKIAEMKTGEGKTLVATLARLSQRARGQRRARGNRSTTTWPPAIRSGWAASIQGLGMSVGVIVHDLDDRERQAAYACDITYGTNNEYGSTTCATT